MNRNGSARHGWPITPHFDLPRPTPINEETTMTGNTRPQRIFMASDLSARCDRALARAALHARAWHSDLTVVHVAHAAEVVAHDRLLSDAPSCRRPESWSQTLARAPRAELAAEGIAATSRVVIGSTADAVLQGATDDRADVVVLGIAKDARMDRIQLGSTVDTLVRRSRVPVLNVRRRARSASRHVVVATDFSTPAMLAVHLAKAALPAPVEAALHRVLEQGTPETVLSDYVASADVDVVVRGG
jgi:nucleotide-binding universal stress UspA family protein